MSMNFESSMILPETSFCNQSGVDLTTFGVGGEIAQLWSPSTMSALQEGMVSIHGSGITPFVIGRGSNLLLRDGGFPGVIVKLSGRFERVTLDNEELIAGAAAKLSSLVVLGIHQGLSGVEFATGIPGTVGGAFMGNAGSSGNWLGEVVEWVEVVTWQGEVVRLTKSEISLSYRKTVLPIAGVVTKVAVKLSRSSSQAVSAACRAYYQRKWQTQPLAAKSAGCVFKNPQGLSAGYLIDRLGFKGLTQGGAKVSERHANFIVNTGGACASDVLQLMERIWNAVHEADGLDLEPEIQIVGTCAPDGWRDRWINAKGESVIGSRLG